MPRHRIGRSARSLLTGLHVAMTFVGLGSLYAPLLCGVNARGQDLVPAPPDMKTPQGGNLPVFAPVQFPEEIEALPSFGTPSSGLGEALERHLGVFPPAPHADPGDRTKPDKTQVKDRLLEAEECLANRNYGDALELFALAIAYDHNSIRAHLGRARAFMMQARYKTAIEDVDFIIDRDPDHREALQIRAFCSLYLGMAGSAEFLDSAARTVAKILKSDPTNLVARAIHGAIALAEQDPDLAIA
jgi:tetratricopeptide (TPR) repeat protein